MSEPHSLPDDDRPRPPGFPREADGRVRPDRAPDADLSPDPEANILPSDAPGG